MGLKDSPFKSRPGAGSYSRERAILAATSAWQIPAGAPAGAPAGDPKTGKTGKTGLKTGNKKMGRKKWGTGARSSKVVVYNMSLCPLL